MNNFFSARCVCPGLQFGVANNSYVKKNIYFNIIILDDEYRRDMAASVLL